MKIVNPETGQTVAGPETGHTVVQVKHTAKEVTVRITPSYRGAAHDLVSYPHEWIVRDGGETL